MRKRLLTSCVGLFCSLCWNLFMGEEGEEVSREKEQYMGVYGNEWLYCGCSANWRRLRHQNSCSMPFFKWKKKTITCYLSAFLLEILIYIDLKKKKKGIKFKFLDLNKVPCFCLYSWRDLAVLILWVLSWRFVHQQVNWKNWNFGF